MLTKKGDAKAMNNDFQELVSQIKETETYDKEVVRDLVSSQIDYLMKKEDVSKAELAKRLGKSRAYITKILQGNANFTLDTLVQIARALGYKFTPMFAPQEIEWRPAIHLSAKASATPGETILREDEYTAPISLNDDAEEDADDRHTKQLVG